MLLNYLCTKLIVSKACIIASLQCFYNTSRDPLHLTLVNLVTFSFGTSMSFSRCRIPSIHMGIDLFENED